MGNEPLTATSLLQLSLSDALGIIALLGSLLGNILQWQRTRSIKNSVYNGLVGVFNGVGWILSYCISRERAVNDRFRGLPAEQLELKSAFEELGQFATSVDHQCRLLHEQIVSIAKTLKIKDARWQGQFFGMGKQDIDRLMKASTEG